MTYGYVRVSTQTQNISRQMEEMRKYGLTHNYIYVDKQSGKDFERKSYQRLKRRLKKNDLLIVKSIDRLGRNYDMIINEWYDLTKKIECDIFVIDFPLLDTRIEGKNLMGKFISDLVLQILSFVAQNERETIKQRQLEGIRLAKERGVHMGRPKYILPSNFKEVVMRYYSKEITHVDALKILKMNKGTFFKYAKMYK
jgi:DNA invertase Pin-like site-specific DNA recombinase